MEAFILDYDAKINETFNITLYSDLHDDASACDIKTLNAHMKRRAALPNSIFCGLGDIGNWIMPGPDRRHTPSTPLPDLAHRDDYIDAAIEKQVERYKGFPWAFIAEGNHESAIRRHHHTDVVARLCKELNTVYARYSGLARFRFKYNGTLVASFTLLYHHGAWGGKVMKGFGGARDWARHAEGWDICAYGHNHYCNVHIEPRLDMTERGCLRSRDVFFVNTGTFQKGYEEGSAASYAEEKGYPPSYIGSPLIKARLSKTAKDNYKMALSVETGDD